MPSSPLLRSFTGQRGRQAVDTITPERTFADVILPPATQRTLEQALAQVRNHALIFERWGLGERHATGLGLAVNVAAVFRTAGEEDAVLFFDEADAIAARRTAGARQAMEREANTVVNVLLRELESFNGVVVFATNLAANFDPAFERRIRTHVLFEMPGVAERARIWQVQLHPLHTPLSADVDFAALAARYPASGGDIKNAVLKAAAAAAAEPGLDVGKRIHQRHFVQGIEDVLASKSVMRQSIFADEDAAAAALLPPGASAAVSTAGRGAADARTALALQAMEARSQRAALVGIALGGAGLLAGLAALVVAALR